MPPRIEDESIVDTPPEVSHKSYIDELSQMAYADADYVDDSQNSEQNWEDDLIVSVVGSRPQPSRKPRTKDRAKMTKEKKEMLDQELLANAPSLERILEVIGMPVRQRHLAEPDCFYPLTGDLRPPFRKFYQEDIQKSKEAPHRDSEASLLIRPSRERILEVASMPCKQRQQEEPECFNASGELRPPFKKLYP